MNLQKYPNIECIKLISCIRLKNLCITIRLDSITRNVKTANLNNWALA